MIHSDILSREMTTSTFAHKVVHPVIVRNCPSQGHKVVI